MRIRFNITPPMIIAGGVLIAEGLFIAYMITKSAFVLGLCYLNLAFVLLGMAFEDKMRASKNRRREDGDEE